MWARSFKNLCCLLYLPTRPRHRDLDACAAKWIDVVLPCSVSKPVLSASFLTFDPPASKTVLKVSARNGGKPWLIGKVEDWKSRNIGLVFLLVCSLNTGWAVQTDVRRCAVLSSTRQERSLMILEIVRILKRSFAEMLCRNRVCTAGQLFCVICGLNN